MKKFLKWTLIASLAGIVALIVGMNFIFSSACGVGRVLQRFPSPSKEYDAVVYDYGCPLSRDGTHVDLFKPNETPTEPGALFNATDKAYVSVRWESDKRLNVSYEANKGFEFEGGKNRHGVTVYLKAQ